MADAKTHYPRQQPPKKSQLFPCKLRQLLAPRTCPRGEIASGDLASRSFIQTSFAYGRILYEIIAAGWTAFLLDDRSDRSRAAIEKHDAAWAEYRTLAATREDCPAIYRDTSCWYLKNKGMIDHPGMGASIERMRQQVGKKIGHSH